MHLIVTCRTTFYESQVHGIVPFEKLYIEKFDPFQVADCARKSLPEEWSAFMESIRARFIHLSELAARPLFLRMLIMLQQTGRLYRINNVGDLYSELTNDWIKKESLREGSLLNEEARRRVVHYLAFTMMLRERGYFELEELRGVVREMMLQKRIAGLEGLDANEVIRDIPNRGFMDVEENKFRFAHQSFMEFFVAEKFVQDLLAKNTSDFSQRILYEEIYEHIAQLTDTTDKRKTLLSVLSDPEVPFIVKVNCIPPLRKQRTPEAIEYLLSALVNDADPLLRYVCGYTLRTFQEDSPDIFSTPANSEFLGRAYEDEHNSLIRCRLALLLTDGAYVESHRELSPDYRFDDGSLAEIVAARGIVAAYEQVLKVRREHPAVIEESMRLLALFVDSGRDSTGVAYSVLTKFMFADGFSHGDQRVRRMTIWVIGFLRLFERQDQEGLRASHIVSNGQRDRFPAVRRIARWAADLIRAS